MIFSNYAKAMLLIGMTTWALCELDIFNAPIKLAEKSNVFDHDLGDQKLFGDQYKVVVDWGNTEFVYGNGEQLIELKRMKYETFDLSWIPFFKHYSTEGEWRIEGFPSNRKHIEADYSVKKFGLVSRRDVISSARAQVSKRLLKAFTEQSFYNDRMEDIQIKFGSNFDAIKASVHQKNANNATKAGLLDMK